MASRSEHKRQARAEREARERESELTAGRRRTLCRLAATSAAAVIVVAVAIGVSQSGKADAGTTTGPPEGVTETRALYEGIPQRGVELGNPNARVTLTEFADLQCPFCAQYGRDVLPEIVRKYVRTGKVKLVFRSLAFIGPDSERGARMVAAAGRQNRLWETVDLIYRNQGAENDGWIDDDYLRRVGTAAGVDVDTAFAERAHPDVEAQLAVARTEAERAHINSTPSFLLTRDATTTHLGIERLEPSEFTKALDAALAR